MNKQEILATAQPTPGRRLLALSAMLMLGGAALYVVFAQTAPLLPKLMLLALGTMALCGAELMRRGTSGRVELTQTHLRDGDGTVIVALDDIDRVNRGVFAFKPSNGFTIMAKTAQPRGWRLGVWWRVGRQIGIGGMMPLHQTKVMAERVVQLIEKRDPQ